MHNLSDRITNYTFHWYFDETSFCLRQKIMSLVQFLSTSTSTVAIPPSPPVHLTVLRHFFRLLCKPAVKSCLFASIRCYVIYYLGCIMAMNYLLTYGILL